jgi:hypothetical protein
MSSLLRRTRRRKKKKAKGTDDAAEALEVPGPRGDAAPVSAEDCAGALRRLPGPLTTSQRAARLLRFAPFESSQPKKLLDS